MLGRLERILGGLATCLCLLASGCGKSAEAVIGENRPYFDELRTKLAAVAQSIEQSSKGQGPPTCTPEAVQQARLDAIPDDPAFNLDVLHHEQLLDVDVDRIEAGGAIDLAASTALARCLNWTGPRSSLDGKASGRAVGDSLARCKQVTHVLVAREVAHDRKTGELRMRYDLARIADATLLCGFDVVSRADPSRGVLSYEIKRPDAGEVVKSETRDEYALELWKSARKELSAAAQDKLGVDIAPK